MHYIFILREKNGKPNQIDCFRFVFLLLGSKYYGKHMFEIDNFEIDRFIGAFKYSTNLKVIINFTKLGRKYFGLKWNF